MAWEESKKFDIKQKAEEYNKLYFGGSLKLDFPMTYSSRLTKAFGRTIIVRYNKARIEVKKIVLTSIIDYTEELFRGILVHELIHVKFSQQGYFSEPGYQDHGEKFKAEVNRIKNEYGVDIPLAEDIDQTKLVYDSELTNPVKYMIIRMANKMDDAGVIFFNQFDKKEYERILRAYSGMAEARNTGIVIDMGETKSAITRPYPKQKRLEMKPKMVYAIATPEHEKILMSDIKAKINIDKNGNLDLIDLDK